MANENFYKGFLVIQNNKYFSVGIHFHGEIKVLD